MKHNGIFIALSAAALFAAGTISAEAQAGFPGVHGGSGAYRAGGHGGGGGFNGAGRGFHGGGGLNAGGAGFRGGGMNAGIGGGGRHYGGGYGRGIGYGLGGAALGYGLSSGYGTYYGDDYAYGDPSYAYGSGDYGYDGGAYAPGAYAYDPQYSGGGYVVQTGRSAAVGGLGKYCTTPAKSCKLYSAANMGADCSCKVSGGRSEGQVTP